MRPTPCAAASPVRTGFIADIGLGEDVSAALSADAPVDVVRRGIAPTNSANPNMIVAHSDGSGADVADDRSPWSAALAQ